jgi:hypothetical protein
VATHDIFYYPYATINDAEQLPLLKAVALYFDKVHILDPEAAVSERIGLYGQAAQDVLLLEQEGILERVGPSDILASYGDEIVQAVHKDLNDPEYLRRAADTNHERWLLALAKIPSQIVEDRTLRQLITIPSPTGEPLLIDGPNPQGDEFYETRLTGQQLIDGQVVGGKQTEFRYRSMPVPLGESIMLNHALFGSLLATQSTPFTDDPFHYRLLNYKIERAREMPMIRRKLDDRAMQDQISAAVLAARTLTDTQLELPTLTPTLPLAVILEYRAGHADELEDARKELAWLAREIENTPWSEAFADDVHRKRIPAIRRKLEEGHRARAAWLKSGRGQLALKGTGVAASGAAAVIMLAFTPTPLLPVAVVTGVLGLVGNAAVPGVAIVRDWLEGRRTATENGLHYLLSIGEDRA